MSGPNALITRVARRMKEKYAHSDVNTTTPGLVGWNGAPFVVVIIAI